jgi:hypothetical protein
MNISKFKLLEGGLSGVRIESIEKMPHENMMFLDDVSRTRKVPLSDELRAKIQNLKYFYLNLTSHWIPPFNAYFDLQEYKLGPLVEKDGKQPQGQTLLHDIWNHTKITGVTIKNGGFVITGEIEVVDGKKIGIPTPFITEEDDLSFYLDARNKIELIMEDLAVALDSRALPMPKDKQMSIAFGEKPEEVEAMDMDELEQRFIDRLMEKGAIIMMNDDNFQHKGVGDGSSKATLHTGTGSIDSHNVPEAELHKEDNEEKSEEEKSEEEKSDEEQVKDIVSNAAERRSEKMKKAKKAAGSTLVADKKFNVDLNEDVPKVIDPENIESNPEGGSMEDLEYSQNLGLSDQASNDESDNKSEW